MDEGSRETKRAETLLQPREDFTDALHYTPTEDDLSASK